MSIAAKELAGAQTLEPGTWTIDASHTTIGAVARHMMVTKVRGRFTEFSGAIEVAEDPKDSKAELTIAATSIDTGSEQRDGHLRSPDFLDVETYPEISFRSTGIEFVDGERFRLTGDFTIRGVTQPLTLDATFEGVAASPFGEGQVAFFTAKGEFDREAFGMTWNHAIEAGGVLVSKKIQLEIEVQATK